MNIQMHCFDVVFFLPDLDKLIFDHIFLHLRRLYCSRHMKTVHVIKPP